MAVFKMLNENVIQIDLNFPLEIQFPSETFEIKMAINTSIPVNKSNYGHGHPPPPIAVKWQCRLIFESEFWKKFKVTNHRSGVTYGCTDQHLTVENFFFQSLPCHLADTAENIKNQPYRGWKIVFLIIQRKWPKFKKWVWPVKIP